MTTTLGRFLTSEHVCERLGISKASLMRYCQQGKGPPRVRLTPGANGHWGYPENLFEEWIISRLERPLETETA